MLSVVENRARAQARARGQDMLQWHPFMEKFRTLQDCVNLHQWLKLVIVGSVVYYSIETTHIQTTSYNTVRPELDWNEHDFTASRASSEVFMIEAVQVFENFQNLQTGEQPTSLTKVITT